MRVPYVIQDALVATADVYREQLQTILEHQDGAAWLEAFNQRRHADAVANRRQPPQPYRSFEPRAVIVCLAYDPAALQLISPTMAAKAKQLSGLANAAAHHLETLSEADGYRAWQLYSEITRCPAPADWFAADHVRQPGRLRQSPSSTDDGLPTPGPQEHLLAAGQRAQRGLSAPTRWGSRLATAAPAYRQHSSILLVRSGGGDS